MNPRNPQNSRYQFIIENDICFKGNIPLVSNSKTTKDPNAAIRVATLQDIYSKCFKYTPTPFGSIVTTDSHIQSNDFTIGWNISDQGIDSSNLKGFDIDLSFIPASQIPIINFSVAVDDGGDGLLFADYNISIRNQQSREILHDLFTSENIHVVVFDGGEEIKLVDFSFTIPEEDKTHFLDELYACYSSIPDYEDNFNDETWSESIQEISRSFRAGGAPINSSALTFYQKRLSYKPAPSVKFWNQDAE